MATSQTRDNGSTELNESIRIKWSGYARRRITGDNQDFSTPESAHFVDAVSRFKSLIVVQSVAEANAVFNQVDRYVCSGRTWITGGMISCLQRIKSELAAGMEQQGFVFERGRFVAAEGDDGDGEGDSDSDTVAAVDGLEAGDDVTIVYKDEQGRRREIGVEVEFNTIGNADLHMFNLESAKFRTSKKRSGTNVMLKPDGSLRVKPRFNANGRGHNGRLVSVERDADTDSDDSDAVLMTDGGSDVMQHAERIAEAGLLTERQAEVYVRREMELTPRQQVAERMGISVNTVDNLLSTAREKVASAGATMVAIDDVKQARDEPEVYVHDHKHDSRLTREFDSLEAAREWVAENQQAYEGVEHGNRYEAVRSGGLL